MRTILLLALCLPVCTFAALDETEAEIKKMEARLTYLETLHKQLLKGSTSMDKLHRKALRTHRANMAKVTLKGGYDAAQKLISPWSGATDIAVDLVAGVVFDEKEYWGVRPESKDKKAKAELAQLDRAVTERYAELKSMNDSLKKVFTAKLERFDDAKPPFKWTKSWWVSSLKEPDKELDNPMTLVTRKMNILVHLSGKIAELASREAGEVANEIADVAQRLAKLRQKRDAEAIAKKVEKQTKPSPKKTASTTVAPKDDQRDEPHIDLNHVRKVEADRKHAAERAALRRKLQKELERKQREREKEAVVYVDAVCPRHVTAGKQAVFVAKVDPNDVAGTFVWTIDDKVMRRSGKAAGRDVFATTFDKEEIHDMQVTLNIRGEYHDRYTTQITVHPAPEPLTPPKPPRYPPKLEGKKTKALDLQWCKYWILHKDGHLYMTGYYYVPSGRKIQYTSEAMHSYSPHAPAAGLIMASGSGTGYHVYRAEADDLEGGKAIYHIVRMRGPKIKILHRLNVHGHFSMKLTPDQRAWIVSYKTEPKGEIKTIRLD